MSSIKMNSSKTFTFNWLNDKNAVVASSLAYTKEDDCLKAIELFKNEAVSAAIENQIATTNFITRPFPKFVISGTTRSCYFTFASSNKKTLLTSAKFSTQALCLAAIEDIKQNVVKAYNLFIIEQRAAKFLAAAEISKSDAITGKLERKIEKIGLRKIPTFTVKTAVPVFKTKALESDNLKKLNTTRTAVVRTSRGKHPTFIDGKFASTKVSSFKTAISSLNNLHYTMGFKNAEQEFKEDTLHSYAKADFYRLQQYHQGIPVYGHQLIVATDKNGNTESVSGSYATITSSSVSSINEDKALETIKKMVSDTMDLTSEGLYYYVDDNEKSTLCWKISTDDTIYFVDAAKATVVESLSRHTCVDRVATDVGKNMSNQEVRFPVTVKTNNLRYLYDAERDIEVCRCQKAGDRDGKRISNTSSTWTGNKDAISAYTNIITTFDYYKNVLGRNGANGKGKGVSVVVGYYTKDEPSYFNAFFTSGYTKVTKICLGNGGDFPKALDVVAHEFTHAVEDSIWDPKYKDESGALDEAYADIMGEFVQDGSLDVIGEDLLRSGFRDFVNPSNTGDPNHYDRRYQGTNDKGGVHTNSCIITHAAYLMQKNWPTPATFVMEMPAVFLMSMNYLSSNSKFLDFRSAILSAARVMRLGNAKEIVIAEALDAVGVCYEEEQRAKNTILVGKVVNESGIAIIDATVTLMKGSTVVSKKVTNSSGQFELGYSATASYKLSVTSPMYKDFSMSMSLSAIGGNQKVSCSDIRLTLKDEYVVILQGNVKNYETKANEANVEVRIYEGCVDVAQSLAMVPGIKVYTDSNGNYSSKAVKKGCTYTVIACRNYTATAGQYFVASKTVYINGKTTCNLEIVRKYRYFVNGLWVYASSKKSNARNGIKPPYKLIDKDLNGWAGGDYIYLGYTIDTCGSPVTNVIIYNTKKKQTWTTKTITVDGKTAEYRRLDVDLNKGAKGSFVYLCLTRDTKFAPLTDIDVVYQGDAVDTRSWKYATGVGDYASGDVNYKTKGKPIYIVFKRD